MMYSYKMKKIYNVQFWEIMFIVKNNVLCTCLYGKMLHYVLLDGYTT